LKKLVENGADINRERNNGATPLFIACQNGHENVVKYLLEHGVNINKELNDGWTPLIIACCKGHENVVKYLLEHGANINKKKIMVPFLYLLHVKIDMKF